MADVLTHEQRDLLRRFLREQTGRAFAWGKCDCGLFLADWVMVAKGVPDPASSVRGTYSDGAGAEAAMGGGLMAFVASCAAVTGCPETTAPKDGDAGVIGLPDQGETCAIMSNNSWVFRTPKGIVWSRVTPGRLVKAWKVF